MLSPRVQDLVERCRRAQEAMAAHAPLIEEQRRGEGAYERTVRGLGTDVATFADAAAEADLGHSRAVQAHQEWAERRDGASAALYREVSQLRSVWRDLYARGRVKRDLALSGKTPRRPSDLIAWAEAVLVVWRDGDGVCKDSFTASGFGELVSRIRKRLDELEVAYDEAGKANLARTSARARRREAIEKCEFVLQKDARVAESFLVLAGRRDLVVDVRGKLPLGRPRKDDLPRSEPKEPDAVAAAPEGRILSSWIGRAARKAGRLFRRGPEERPDLRRAA